MFKAEEMQKLRIYCQKGKLKDVIAALHDAKAMDIIEHQQDETLDIGTPLKEAEQVSDAAVKARSIIYRLGIDENQTKKNEIGDYPKTFIKEISTLNDEVSSLFTRKKEIGGRVKSLQADQESIQTIEKLGVDLELYKETKHVNYLIGFVEDIKGLRRELREKIKVGYELFHTVKDNRSLVSIFVDREQEWDLMDIIRKYSFTEFKIPSEFYGDQKALSKIKVELKKLEKEEQSIDTKIKQLKRKHEKDIVAKERFLTKEAKKAEAPLMFAESKNLAIITGWVPATAVRKLSKAIDKITKSNVSIDELQIKKADSVPIKLNNPGLMKPYEFLLRMFSMPSYKELDPTIFMFITFPLFFGFMLGDIGYGVVTLILFSLLKLKLPEAKDLLNIMIFCSISAIIFGGVFGEAFGYELVEFMHEEPAHAVPSADVHLEAPVDTHAEAEIVHNGTENATHGTATAHAAEDDGHGEGEHETHGFLDWVSIWPWHRNADNALNLIIMAVIMGVFHVNLGLIFGFRNIYKAHGFGHAMNEKGAWFVLQIAVAIIALSKLGILQSYLFYVGLIMVLIAAVMLYLGEGVQGLVELPAIFVHIGSYMRLMAIGLASVGLAVVINEQTGPLFAKGPIGVIGAILIFTIGHVINIALGIIGPFLHSLRLHYVEHFTKYYSGGGKEFSPFGAENKK